MQTELTYEKVFTGFMEAQDERAEWESEWRFISEYLVPGRGVYQTYAKPRKRKLTSGKVVNPAAEDALIVLTSGMHGRLTSPSKPWFDLSWADQRLQKFEPLKAWLEDCTLRLHRALHSSNFYAIINSFYTEYAAFGNGCVYVGEDTQDALIPFRFELLTAGEYSFIISANGKIEGLYRTIFRTQRQIVERFGDKVSPEIRKKVKEHEPGIDKQYVTILEFVIKKPYGKMAYTRVYYELASTGVPRSTKDRSRDPLEVAGFHEFPYPVARWSTIGSDVYGIGPGSRALPDIQRLQEMEKSFLMATHKALDPPLNAPARMKGKLNSLPGGKNYYANPNEIVKELYQMKFDFNGVGAAIERVEERIQRNFFNEIFLTATRDPNASPLKARQVDAQEMEQMFRLGPVIERLQYEFFQPLIERCFNIMRRKNMFQELPPELMKMAGEYDVSLISPLATAQRAASLQGINTFLGFVGQAAQFDQQVMDNIDIDETAREYADITGVRLGILRPEEDVKQIRIKRVKAMQQEKAKQDAMQQAQATSEIDASKATAQKTQAEAGTTLLEGQQIAQQMGTF